MGVESDTAAGAVNPLDDNEFRRVLGHFPTGVAFVTALTAQGVPTGMLVGSFVSVSLQPPLVAFLPAKSSTTFPYIRAADSFCVNVLSSRHQHLCATLSSRSTLDKFAALAWSAAPSGAPIIEDAVAWVDCLQHDTLDAGDHYIALGKVTALKASGRSPLIFCRGSYGRFEPAQAMDTGKE